MKICFLGLSGSGKTCYLYAASSVLTEGVRTAEGSVSILCTSVNENILLNKGIEDMDNGDEAVWPRGSDQTIEFPYDLYINGINRTKFEIYDYRGGALYDDSDIAQTEREKLYETFRESSCIVVFIDAYNLMKVFSLKNHEDESDAYRKADLKAESILKAKNRLSHLKLIINEARQYLHHEVPILLTITKKDILSEDELNTAMEGLKTYMTTLFSEENPNPVGITAVSLGTNLGAGEFNENKKKKLTGCLHLDVSQNIHIPILFPLFNGLELSPKEAQIAKKIFNNNVLKMYIKGKPAVITF